MRGGLRWSLCEQENPLLSSCFSFLSFLRVCDWSIRMCEMAAADRQGVVTGRTDDMNVVSHTRPTWLLPRLNEAGLIWRVCPESASLSSHFYKFISHIKERRSRGNTPPYFPSRPQRWNAADMRMFVCVETHQFPLLLHSFLCLSLHLIQASLLQSLFSAPLSSTIRCETDTCRCVCVKGRMLPPACYPLFHPFSLDA